MKRILSVTAALAALAAWRPADGRCGELETYWKQAQEPPDSLKKVLRQAQELRMESLQGTAVEEPSLLAAVLRKNDVVMLYGKPGRRPDPACDRGTRMAIDLFARTATLENVVNGPCEVLAVPDRRVYRLDPGVGNASLVHILGKRVKQGGGEDLLDIIDYRGSLTPIPSGVKSLVRTVETLADGTRRELYSAAFPTIRSLTTERIVRTETQGDNRVAISIGFGAGSRARGGAIGLEINGRAFEVLARRGEDAARKVQELRELISASGFRVIQRKLRAIDTYELVWIIEEAAAPSGPPFRSAS